MQCTETIKIARNNWSASAVEVEIFKQLVEANLCNPVEILDIDENAMFAGMSTGDVDVNSKCGHRVSFPRNRPSSMTVRSPTWATSEQRARSLVRVRLRTRAVPAAVLVGRSEGPAVAKAFARQQPVTRAASSAWTRRSRNTTRRSSRNLGLPFSVQFSGSEAATQAEISALSADKKPIILYYWSPSGAVGSTT